MSDIALAREEIRSHVGEGRVEADAKEIRFYGAQGVEATLLRAAGGTQISFSGSGGRILEYPQAEGTRESGVKRSGSTIADAEAGA